MLPVYFDKSFPCRYITALIYRALMSSQDWFYVKRWLLLITAASTKFVNRDILFYFVYIIEKQSR